MTILRQTTPDAPTTMLPVIPQAAPRRERGWLTYGLAGAGLGLLLLGPWLGLLAAVGAL